MVRKTHNESEQRGIHAVYVCLYIHLCMSASFSMAYFSRCLSVCSSSCAPLAGESVEENANVVVRLLIRRPECFGPALRGEGGNGLLAAMEEAIKISEDPCRDGPSPTSEDSKTL